MNHRESYYLSTVFGHRAVFDRPEPKPEQRSPLQRVMRRVKKLRGLRYWDRLHADCVVPLPSGGDESWFQLPAQQKEERLLTLVDWSGVSPATRDKIIARELLSRDGEINAQDEWHLHDQLMRVERATIGWDRLPTSGKLEALLGAKEVDWRPFPPEFRAVALGHMIRRVVEPAAEGFRIVGEFETGGEVPQFGKYKGPGERDAFEQWQRKGPRRPQVSKQEARETFRWSVAQPRWEAFVREHRDVTDPERVRALQEEFRAAMRPFWREFREETQTFDRDQMTRMAIGWRPAAERSPLDARRAQDPLATARARACTQANGPDRGLEIG